MYQRLRIAASTDAEPQRAPRSQRLPNVWHPKGKKPAATPIGQFKNEDGTVSRTHEYEVHPHNLNDFLHTVRSLGASNGAWARVDHVGGNKYHVTAQSQRTDDSADWGPFLLHGDLQGWGDKKRMKAFAQPSDYGDYWERRGPEKIEEQIKKFGLHDGPPRDPDVKDETTHPLYMPSDAPKSLPEEDHRGRPLPQQLPG
jgi:hypothetical protein